MTKKYTISNNSSSKKNKKITKLEIKNLHTKADNKKILKGINLTVQSGEIHAIMGPNGSGKSSLCKTILGHENYKILKGTIKLNNQNLLNLKTHKRAQLGIFLGFQAPIEIPGVSLNNFLRTTKNNIKKEPENPLEFLKKIKKEAKSLKISEELIDRGINENLSGGEKKKTEIMQMSILEPKIIILDEIDSGLDIDALKLLTKKINQIFEKNNNGIILITHYQRILNYIKPNFVHIISDGKIIKSGTSKLAKEIEKNGYENFIKS